MVLHEKSDIKPTESKMKKYAYTIEFEKSVLRKLLGENEKWAKRALVRIYEAQTSDEKSSGETVHENDVGFTGNDAKLLTKIAKYYLANDFIGEVYMRILYDRMPKYAGQIFCLPDFDHEMFDRQIKVLIESKHVEK